MKIIDNNMKKYIILIFITIFTYWGLNNLNLLFESFNFICTVFSPFILGGMIAFILNIPTKKIENLLNKKIKNKKCTRIIAIILSLLIFVLVIIFVAFLLIPELISNITLLMKNLPNFMNKTENFILDLLNKYPDIQNQIKDIFSASGNITDIISNILNYFINGAIGIISGLVSSVISIFTALIFSIYMLSQKEYLIKITKKVIYAIFNENKSNKLIKIGILANKTFSKFISGQCVEAVILGSIIFVISLIFRFPYALIIAVLTSITALIPIFGALIAMVIGAILIGITNPIQALIFIIVFLVIQQIEGNLIYPKVVGASVGLSPMWTLLAISVGGSLFGIVGMLIGLPLASVIYAILKEAINNRLKSKNYEVV